MGPSFLAAQSTGRALLHSDGSTWMNGVQAPKTTAIFADALIQTPKGHNAKIDAGGSTVVIQPETVVQFEGDELVLDHGLVQLTTGRGMRVRINCMTVVPSKLDWTQYDVSDIDGRVNVVANKKDVEIHYKAAATRGAKGGQSSATIVHEGEQSNRDEKCGAGANPVAPITAKGAILNSVWAKSAGGATVAAIACLGLCPTDDPPSPWKP